MTSELNEKRMASYLAATPALTEARSRPQAGGVGSIKVGDVFQVDAPEGTNGKATIGVTAIEVIFGIGDPSVTVFYKYKVNPGLKGEEKNGLKDFLRLIGVQK